MNKLKAKIKGVKEGMNLLVKDNILIKTEANIFLSSISFSLIICSPFIFIFELPFNLIRKEFIEKESEETIVDHNKKYVYNTFKDMIENIND